jgi:hypothetical protein
MLVSGLLGGRDGAPPLAPGAGWGTLALLDIGGAGPKPVADGGGGGGGAAMLDALAVLLGGPAGEEALDMGGGGVGVGAGDAAAPPALFTHFLSSGSNTNWLFSPRFALTGFLDPGGPSKLPSFLPPHQLPSHEPFC